MTTEVRRDELEPRTLEDVYRLARVAAETKFFGAQTPQAAAVIVLTGRELGLSAMQSLRGIYVVQGRPVLSADLMVAVVRRSGLCDSWATIESTDKACTIETRRKGEAAPARKTWTAEDAKRADLVGKSIWKQYPAQMLRHRCAADLAREVYPDVLLGVYCEGEIEEPVQATARVVTEPSNVLDVYETVTSRLNEVLDLESAAVVYVDSEAAMNRLGVDSNAHSRVREKLVDHLEAIGLTGVRSKINGAIHDEKARRETPAASVPAEPARTLEAAVLDHLTHVPAQATAPIVESGPPTREEIAERHYTEAVTSATNREAVGDAWASYGKALAPSEGKRLWRFALDAIVTFGVPCSTLPEANAWLTQRVSPAPVEAPKPRTRKIKDTAAEREATATVPDAQGRVAAAHRDYAGADDAAAWRAHLAEKRNRFDTSEALHKRRAVFVEGGCWLDRYNATISRLGALLNCDDGAAQSELDEFLLRRAREAKAKTAEVAT